MSLSPRSKAISGLIQRENWAGDQAIAKDTESEGLCKMERGFRLLSRLNSCLSAHHHTGSTIHYRFLGTRQQRTVGEC